VFTPEIVYVLAVAGGDDDHQAIMRNSRQHSLENLEVLIFTGQHDCQTLFDIAYGFLSYLLGLGHSPGRSCNLGTGIKLQYPARAVYFYRTYMLCFAGTLYAHMLSTADADNGHFKPMISIRQLGQEQIVIGAAQKRCC
jgi:hypothetical protein